MEILPYSIPISLLRQHCFCRRIPWFNEIKQINPQGRKWLAQGLSFHKKQVMLTKRRNLSRYGLAEGDIFFNKSLKSSFMPCHGIADAIIETEHQVTVLDFKLGERKPTKGQIFQVAAYGMLAEEFFEKPCKNVFVLIGDRGQTFCYELHQSLRLKVKCKLDELIKILESPVIPDSSATEKQCGQCEYFNFCGDR